MVEITHQSVPLTQSDDGTLRIGDTRVTLDSVIAAFDRGATPEEILQSFGALKLDEIYAVITYFLRNQESVRAYLTRQSAETDVMRTEIEAEFPARALRERLRRAGQARSSDAKS